MEVIARKKPGTWWGSLVRWYTWGPYSHIELRFSDDWCFSTGQVPKPDGALGLHAAVRFAKFTVQSSTWDRWQIKIPENTERELRDWCVQRCGRPYDWLGILGVVLNWHIQSPFSWYCSELCARALSVFDVFPFPHTLSPNQMVKIMRMHPHIFHPVI